MRVLQVTPQEAGQRLDRFLMKYMQMAPKSFVYKMLRKKNIKLNGRRAEGAEKLCQGDEVTLYLADDTIDGFRQREERAVIPKGQKVSLDVVYEDEDILIINKPVGMLSQKADKSDVSLVEYLSEYLSHRSSEQTFRPGICNRLDRNTSGLIVAGKTVHGLQWMNQLFRERDLKKYYLCIVKGKVEGRCRIDGFLTKNTSHNTVSVSSQPVPGAAPIETEYEPLQQGVLHGQIYTLLKVHLITGKSHQIRAHLQSIGHPIVGDGKYGQKDQYHIFKKEFGIRYQQLHAWQLEIGNAEYLPEKYQGRQFVAPPSRDFVRVMKGLGIHCLTSDPAHLEI